MRYSLGNLPTTEDIYVVIFYNNDLLWTFRLQNVATMWMWVNLFVTTFLQLLKQSGEFRALFQNSDDATRFTSGS